jgi:hypothetical protein
VEIEAIPNLEFRKLLPKSGCCGEHELVKLEALKLTDYVKVVMLDADSLVLQNIDDVISDPTDAIWTIDRYLGGGCINGGFLIAKPSVEVYDSMLAWVQEGIFYTGGPDIPAWGGIGWNGSGTGYCYGGQTFQGARVRVCCCLRWIHTFRCACACHRARSFFLPEFFSRKGQVHLERGAQL